MPSLPAPGAVAARQRALGRLAGIASRHALAAALVAWITAKQLHACAVLVPFGYFRPGLYVSSLAGALLVVGCAMRWRGRTQLAVLCALDAALTLPYQANLLYYRQFSDYLSVAALGYAAQATKVAGAILSLFEPSDLVFWVDVAALLVLAAAPGERPWPREIAARRAGDVALVGLLLFGAAALQIEAPARGHRTAAVPRARVIADVNVVGYQVFDAVTHAVHRLGRAASDATSLGAASAFYTRKAHPSGPLTGSQLGRNVIVLQLESTQAFALGMEVNGLPVTPALDRLARESIVFSRFYAQIGGGTTSDAEFLGACSQYPLRSSSVFMSDFDDDFRCLPELLRERGYRAVAMHANEPTFWNRAAMYRTLGYDRFFSEADFPREPSIGMGLADGPFLVRAAEHLASLPEPYYAVLITLTNHAPFTHRGLPQTLDATALGSQLAPYLNSVHYEDAALGEFLERLRVTGVLDRSVLVVYGDHLGVRRDPRVAAELRLPVLRADAWLEFERRVPLLIRLPGGRAARRDEPAGQVDLAPTIADLVGLPLGGTFFHGRSLVSSPALPVVFPDGSVLDEELTFLAEGGPSGTPLCLHSDGARAPAGRCDAIADYASRELSVSRSVLEGNLVPWMLAATARGEIPGVKPAAAPLRSPRLGTPANLGADATLR